MTDSHFRRRAAALGALALCVLAVLAFAPMLSGGFLLDDEWNIVENSRITSTEIGLPYWVGVAFGAEAGPLKRPLATLSFGLNYRLFGMDPAAFKAVNLLLHLACGGLVFLLARRLMPYLRKAGAELGSSNWLALASAGIWLLHPLQVSTVSYVVQRMTILSALFTLAGLLCYVAGRERMMREGGGLGAAVGRMLALGALASLCKENGVLTVVYAAAIELTAFRFAAADAAAQQRLQRVFGLAGAILLLVAVAYFSRIWDSLSATYAARDFTMAERLLTEARVLWLYLGWIAWPDPSALGLYHDDIAISRGGWTPPATLFAVLAWTCVLGAAWAVRARWPAFSFAVAWFLGGHLLESTALPLEIAFEHRNYLPLAGITLAAVVLGGQAVINLRLRSAACAAFAVALLGSYTAMTHARATLWSDPLRHALIEAEHHPHSVRAAHAAGSALLRAAIDSGNNELFSLARNYFQNAEKIGGYAIEVASAIVHTYEGAVELPADAVDRLAISLRSAGSVRTRPLLSVIEATITGRLALSQRQVETLVMAVLDNPAAKDTARADALNALGHYHFDARGDAQQAVSLTLMAAASAPEAPVYRINVAELALRLERPDIAREHIEAAERLDRTRVYADDIARLRMRLEDRQSAR